MKQIRKRPELILCAVGLAVAAAVVFFLAAQDRQAEAVLSPTTQHISDANPFDPNPQQPMPPLPSYSVQSYSTTAVIGYTGVTVYEWLPEQTTRPSAQQTSGQQPGSVMVNINTATAAQLETLPGIGPARAQAILEWRNQNGPFRDPAQLLEISGIGEATLRNILPFLYI